MMCTHVDDLPFAYTDEGKEAVDAILNRFSVGKIEEGSFRYCGCRFSQDDDHTIHVDVRDNTRNLKPAAIGKDRRMNDPLAQEELTSLRSVVGGLAWVSRYGRPDLAYRVDEFQRCCHSKITVQTPIELWNSLCREVTSKSFSKLTGLIGTILRSLPFLLLALQTKLSSRANTDVSIPSRLGMM
jgi:hypothetical protein